jgi:hypothetical protein
VCNKVFSRYSYLIRHQSIHIVSQSYSCV